MSSIHFTVCGLQGVTSNYSTRLQEVSSQLCKKGFVWPAQLSSIANVPIKDIGIGPNYVAFLLQDGRVCRVGLTVHSDRLSFARDDNTKGKPTPSGSGAAPANISAPAIRGGQAGTESPGGTRQKVRRIAVMTTRGRGGARGVIVGTRPLVPVSAVPEELIAQAQVVLQGKSRDAIVRELQRTGLDVNQAVNNLLSREDDDGDEFEEASDSYFPEELINLLDAGLSEHPGVIIDADALYADDVFGYHTIRRRAAERASMAVCTPKTERTNELKDSSTSVKSVLNPVVPGHNLQFWSEKEDERFICIAAMHSELVAVGFDGKLYQWRWASDIKNVHPRAQQLGLMSEKIVKMDAFAIRCTLLTESNKVASFVDESLGPDICSVLDFPASHLAEKVTDVYSCQLYSCARVDDGAVYWWGLLPFSMRRKLWDKTKRRVKKHVTFDSNEIVPGTEVRLRANPLYQAGSLGFTLVNGYPQVGTLMEAAWTLTEICRFKIKDVNELSLERSDEGRMDTADTFRTGDTTAAPDNMEDSLRRRVRQAFNDVQPDQPGRIKRSGRDDEPQAREDAWHLKDVVFIEECRPPPTGVVVMVDGAYCAVRFPHTSQQGEAASDLLKTCRLMRKDELQAFKPGHMPKQPEVVQRDPKKLHLPQRGQLLDIAVTAAGLQLLLSLKKSLALVSLSLTGKVMQESVFPTTTQAFLGAGSRTPKLFCCGDESATFLSDGNGCLYLFGKDCIGAVRDPVPLNLPPVGAIALGTHLVKPSNAQLCASGKKQVAMIAVFTLQPSALMQRILYCDALGVKQFFAALEHEANLDRVHDEIVNARIDGNRNIFHALLAMSIPATNKENVDGVADAPAGGSQAQARSLYDTKWEQLMASGSRGAPMSVSQLMSLATTAPPPFPCAETRTADALALEPLADVPIPTMSWPPEGNDPLDSSMADVANIPLPSFAKAISDSRERQRNAMDILKFLCDSPLMASHLQELLTARDHSGLTPFMYAVVNRLYGGAMQLLDAAERLSKVTPTVEAGTLLDKVFPTGSNPDHSPLYVLCTNDTCSFTWTGDEHINQDIFECKTCGLVGTLCCCTECATVCHKGHECKLKRTSPTAYCDCWESAHRCHALIAGNQSARHALLMRLLELTDLVTQPNKKGEHLLLYLAKTVGRQLVEQRQYHPSRPKQAIRANADAAELDMPEHDLEPPKFAKRALDVLLERWDAVSSMIMPTHVEAARSQALFEDQFYLCSQEPSVFLDRFTHCLIVKCSPEMLDKLLATLIVEMQTPGHKLDAERVAARFVRSVVRVFVALTSTVPSNGSKKKSVSQAVLKCRRVFQALLSLALRELTEAADALMAPVRLGMTRACRPFSLAASGLEPTDNCEKLLAVDPLPPLFAPDPDEVGVRRDGRSSDNDMDDESDSDSDSGQASNSTRPETSAPPGPPTRLSIPMSRAPRPIPVTVASTMSPFQDEARSSSAAEDALDMAMAAQETGYYSDQDDASIRSDTGEEDVPEAMEGRADQDMDREVGDVVPSDSEPSESEPEENIPESSEAETESPHRDSQRGGDVAVSATLAPTSLGWAISRRSRPDVAPERTETTAATARTDITQPQTTSTLRQGIEPALAFLEPSSLRRQSSTAALPGIAAAAAASAAETQNNVPEAPSAAHTAGLLARTYGLIVRQICDLLAVAYDYQALAPSLKRLLVLSRDEAILLQQYVEQRLKPTWNWLFVVLDSLEAQLRFGSALASFTDPSHPNHPNRPPGPPPETPQTSSAPAVQTPAVISMDPRRALARLHLSVPSESDNQCSVARREFVQYAFSLMRSQSAEHADELPLIELSMLKHIAYVADALLIYLNGQQDVPWNDGTVTPMPGGDGGDTPANVSRADMVRDGLDVWDKPREDLLGDVSEDIFAEDFDDQREATVEHRFFKRTDSMSYLGQPERVLPFEHSVSDSLPLADRPHLLQPDAPRDKLFGLRAKALNYHEHMAASAERGHKNPANLSLSTREQWRGCGDDGTSTEPEAGGRAHSVIVFASDKAPATALPRVVVGTTDPPRAKVECSTRTPVPHDMDSRMWFGRSNFLMGRWKLTLSTLARVFCDDVGQEPGSTLLMIAGFPVKQQRFKKAMEKLRNNQTKDLVLEVDRERRLLLPQALKQLNAFYCRRAGIAAGPPLAVHRVKVTFKDEPGEGTGVARSFYTAIAEAFLVNEKLPNLDHCQATVAAGRQQHRKQQLLNRLRNREREREIARRRGGFAGLRRYPLNPDAPPFMPNRNRSSPTEEDTLSALDPSKQGLGERLFPRVRQMRPTMAAKITGMLLEQPAHQLLMLLAHDETLRMYVEEAVDLVLATQSNNNADNDDPMADLDLSTGDRPTSASTAGIRSKKSVSTPNLGGLGKGPVLDPDDLVDDAPLFFQAGNGGFYAPNPGKATPERLNAFRNVGRVIGLCLLQNELLALPLCRHVLKYILGRPITWFDLAFFDTRLFESLRSVVRDGVDPTELNLTFAVDLLAEEGGGKMELKPGGADIPVTGANVVDYIYRYVDHRLTRIPDKALELMKQGVFDVLPTNALESLSAEDLRLMLNGVSEINVAMLQAYTSFSDESSAPTDQQARYKRWFWSVVESMNAQEKQDLVYFWTGSPALPSNEEGFQPLPSVVIRPPDDLHLPTANTCISRLYLPLYSSKLNLKQKLLLAIKARNFGFV